MWPVLKDNLPKCGISTSISTSIRDGPVLSDGGGMLAMFHYQGTSRTAMIVEQCHKNTTAGKFLQICIEDLVMEIGWYGSLWKHTFNRFSKYTSNHSLIYYTCQYNASHDIHIEVTHHEIHPKRKGDMAIIDLAT